MFLERKRAVNKRYSVRVLLFPQEHLSFPAAQVPITFRAHLRWRSVFRSYDRSIGRRALVITAFNYVFNYEPGSDAYHRRHADAADVNTYSTAPPSLLRAIFQKGRTTSRRAMRLFAHRHRLKSPRVFSDSCREAGVVFYEAAASSQSIPGLAAREKTTKASDRERGRDKDREKWRSTGDHGEGGAGRRNKGQTE